MWKTLRNISSVIVDLTIVGSKEVKHQIDKANSISDSKTSKLAAKAAKLRQEYETKYAPVQNEQEDTTKQITDN